MMRWLVLVVMACNSPKHEPPAAPAPPAGSAAAAAPAAATAAAPEPAPDRAVPLRTPDERAIADIALRLVRAAGTRDHAAAYALRIPFAEAKKLHAQLPDRETGPDKSYNGETDFVLDTFADNHKAIDWQHAKLYIGSLEISHEGPGEGSPMLREADMAVARVDRSLDEGRWIDVTSVLLFKVGDGWRWFPDNL